MRFAAAVDASRDDTVPLRLRGWTRRPPTREAYPRTSWPSDQTGDLGPCTEACRSMGGAAWCDLVGMKPDVGVQRRRAATADDIMHAERYGYDEERRRSPAGTRCCNALCLVAAIFLTSCFPNNKIRALGPGLGRNFHTVLYEKGPLSCYDRMRGLPPLYGPSPRL
jgi:hypothetical protein